MSHAGLADLKQLDPEGIEDQPVGESGSPQVERIASKPAWMSDSRCPSR
jgi:hypothetical protein